MAASGSTRNKGIPSSGNHNGDDLFRDRYKSVVCGNLHLCTESYVRHLCMKMKAGMKSKQKPDSRQTRL